MTDQQFDEFLKGKLSGHASPVKEEVWQKIIAEKDKKRRIIFWLPVAALFLLIGSGVYFFANKENKKEQKLASNIYTSPATGKAHTAIAPDRNIEEIINKEMQPVVKKNSGSKNNLDKTFKYQSSTNKTFLPSQEKENNNKTDNSALNKIDVFSSDDVNKVQQQQYKEEATPLALNSGQPQDADKKIQLASVDSVTGNNDIAISKNDTKSPGATNIIKPHKANFKKWFLEIYGAPEYAFQSLTASQDKNLNIGYDRLENIVATKNQSEKFLLSFSAGFRIARQLNKSLSIKTGVEYRQINARFKNQSTYAQNVNINPSYLNYLDNISLTGAGYYSIFSQQNSSKVESYTLYKSFSIPVLFSYEKVNSKFSIGVTAGPMFNIYRSYSGYSLSSSLQPNLRSEDSDYKRNTGISLYAGLSFIKPLTKKIQLFAEPHLQYSLTSVTKKSAVFNQKIHNTGISIGIRLSVK